MPRKSCASPSQLIWELGDKNDPRGVKDYIKNPADVAFIGENYIIVADSEGHRLLIFDINGRLAQIIGNDTIWPSSIAVTRDQNIVVTNRKSKQIELYDLTGRLLLSFGQIFQDLEGEIEEKPHGVAVNSKGQFLVSDLVLHNITVYSSEGKQLRRFGTHGSHIDQFNLPFYIAVDYRDNVIVSDNMNYSVKVFDMNGNYRHKIGYKIGSGVEWDSRRQFLCPYGVLPTSMGVCIADHETHRIGVYDRHGELVEDVLNKANWCKHPTGIAANSRGLLACTENSYEHAAVKLWSTEMTM